MRAALIDDDEGTALHLASEAAAELGFAVDATSDPVAFKKRVLDRAFDLHIIDYTLPGAQQAIGLRDGPSIVALTAARGANVPTVLLTNFGSDCAKRMAEFDPRLIYAIAEKPTTLTKSAWVASLKAAIDEVQAEASNLESALGFPVAELRSRFFHESAEALHALDEDERDRLESEAILELHNDLSPLWSACDSTWIKLQRVDDVVMVTERGTDAQQPDEYEVEYGERRHAYGALIAGRPLLIEEVSTCSPTGSRNWARYPFVQLTINDLEIEFHLDTGSHASFVGRELLESAGIDIPAWKFRGTVVEDLAGTQEVQHQVPLVVRVFADGPDGHFELKPTMQAVKRWFSGHNMFNHPCEKGLCPNSGSGQCSRRLGLMGRNLLYELSNGSWQVSPETGQFSPVQSRADRLR